MKINLVAACVKKVLNVLCLQYTVSALLSCIIITTHVRIFVCTVTVKSNKIHGEYSTIFGFLLNFGGLARQQLIFRKFFVICLQ